MKTYAFNKIVRDKVKTRLDNRKIAYKTIDLITEAEKTNFFKAKLVEEAAEVQAAATREELIEELADCMEVIAGFAHTLNVSLEELEQAREAKNNQRGAFYNADAIAHVTIPADHPFAKYYDENPDKYPLLDSETETN